jgi:hypothetical protein
MLCPIWPRDKGQFEILRCFFGHKWKPLRGSSHSGSDLGSDFFSFPTAFFFCPRQKLPWFFFFFFLLSVSLLSYSQPPIPLFSNYCPNKWLAINKYKQRSPKSWGKAREKLVCTNQKFTKQKPWQGLPKPAHVYTAWGSASVCQEL